MRQREVLCQGRDAFCAGNRLGWFVVVSGLKRSEENGAVNVCRLLQLECIVQLSWSFSGLQSWPVWRPVLSLQQRSAALAMAAAGRFTQMRGCDQT